MKSGLKIPDNPVSYHLLAAIIGTQCQVYCPETQWPFMIPQEVFARNVWNGVTWEANKWDGFEDMTDNKAMKRGTCGC